ncbi:hypothetical protein ACFQ4C_18115 [Larkinella insperata]|uniref:Uncharacterized protein n=1 Tax=Larkinella insperata TaxID=332158 RepID=A0ABW3Q651_9BACT|nr:hypothetical protein [Larkinella insperata]
MNYSDLDINAKINLKAALRAWAKYSVDHFQDELDKKVYRSKVLTRKKGGRDSKGRFTSAPPRRSGALRKSWWTSVQGDRVTLLFLQYGRYVDMGVGKGVSHTDRVVSRLIRDDAPGRRRKPWYSKRKGYEIRRLREILTQMHVSIPVDAIENALTFSVNLSV